MNKWERAWDIFAVVGIASIVYLSYVGTHEMGHYIVNEQNDIPNRQICFLGWVNDRNGSVMSAMGWTASDWTNKTEVDEWHESWDYAWYGWIYDVFNIGEEI